MKKKVQYYFNQGASTYDETAEVQVHVANQLIQYIKNHSAETILEIGCGTGLYSQQLFTLFPNGSFLLTDIAEDMIKVCQNKFANRSNIDFLCMDAEKINVSQQFDLITSSMTFHWFTDIKKSLENLIDKLQKGGKLIFSLVGNQSLTEWQQSCEKFQIQAGTPSFPTFNDLSAWFPSLKIDRCTFHYTYSNVYSFLQSLKKLGARASRDFHQPQSVAKLRHLLSYYSKEYPVSYEILYGSFTKS